MPYSVSQASIWASLASQISFFRRPTALSSNQRSGCFVFRSPFSVSLLMVDLSPTPSASGGRGNAAPRLTRLDQDLAVGAAARLLDGLHGLVQCEPGRDDLPVVQGAARHEADHVGEDVVARVA